MDYDTKRSSMAFLVFVISFLIAFENIIPTLVGFTNTPSGMVFLGTVHHAQDYFYYLSQVTQANGITFFSSDLYTSEHLPLTIIGWSNILLGNVARIFSVPPIIAYQTTIFFYTFAIGVVMYILSKKVLHSAQLGIYALYVFFIFHAFPTVTENSLSYYDFWNNIASPRVRFGGVPHQLLIAIFSISIFITFLSAFYERKKSSFITLLFCFSTLSILLASLQPMVWTLLAVSVVGTIAIQKESSITRRISLILSFIIPGSSMCIYLFSLFHTQPFLQLKEWENNQQVSLSLLQAAQSFGPVFCIWLASLPIFLRRRSLEHTLIAIFSMLSGTLFLSQITKFFGISNVRVLSTAWVATLSIIAVYGIDKFSSFISKKIHTQTNKISLILYAILFVLLVSSHNTSVTISSVFNRENAYHYLPSDEYQFLIQARNISTNNDVFLVLWPYNAIFPGITGRKSYNGHPLLTINSKLKDANAAAFFDGKMTENEAREFIHKSNITFVIAYTWMRHVEMYSFLSEASHSERLRVYHVK